MRYTAILLAILVLLAGFGCVSVDPARERTRFRTALTESTGILPLEADEHGKFEDQVANLLKDGLTRDEAVRVGLAQNPAFQARLEEIGLAKADLVQAGLPENPKFRGLFRWPEEGDLNYELEIGFNLASLWQVPLRNDVASLELEMALASLGHEALHLAAEIETAFDRVVFLGSATQEKGLMAGRSQALVDEMEKRQRFGYEAADEVHGVRVEAVEARVGEIKARTRLKASRAELVRLLGLDRGNPELIPSNPPKIPHLPPFETLLTQALKNRADIQAARLQVRAAAKGIGLARSEVVKELEIGFNYEREPDGSALYGPEIGLEVPLFDLNQGGLGRARALARRAVKMLRAREVRVREELVRDLAMLEAARAGYRAVDEEIIPLRTKTLEFTRKYVAAMQLNKTHLLEAEMALSLARLEREEALLELRSALIELKRDLGGNWPGH